jgi:hypothetical protein
MLRRGFVVEVQGDHLIVRVTGTSYVASFYRADDSTELIVRHLPMRNDHRAPMSRFHRPKPITSALTANLRGEVSVIATA